MATSCYDRDGQPIDVREWSVLLDSHLYRRVAWSEIGEGDDAVQISTVWVGLDQSLGLDGAPPAIFETMIFGGPDDGERWLWSTEDGARAGHADVVRYVTGEGDEP